MYMQKPPVLGDPYIFRIKKKHQGHKKSSQKHPKKMGFLATKRQVKPAASRSRDDKSKAKFERNEHLW